MNRSGIFNTIQSQIFISFCIIIAIIWTGLLLVLYNSYKTNILRETRSNAENIIEMFTLLSVPYILSEDYLGLQHITDNLTARKEIKFAHVICENKEDVISHKLTEESLRKFQSERELFLAQEGGINTSETVMSSGEKVLDIASIVRDVSPQKVCIRILYSLEDTYALINSYRNRMLLIGLMAVVVAFGFSYFIARRITWPIKIITEAFGVFGMGERNIHLDIRSNNETRFLGEAFNKMVQDFIILEKEQLRDERLKTLKRISKDMAKAMRSPIYSLYSVVQMFQVFPQDPKVMKKAVEIYNKEMEKLRELNMYFDYLTQERNTILEKLNLNIIIDELVNKANMRKDSPGIQIEKRLGLLPEIELNKLEISIVLEKLLMNAVESIGTDGYIKIVSQYGENSDPKEIIVMVSDNGTGIKHENESRIFEPFFTTKEDCLGLGLNIARVIAEFYGRRIVFTNRQNGGAAFYLIIPVQS